MSFFLLNLLWGMKFRKRIKIFPWVTLNLSKKGISTTLGVPGLSINNGPKGTFLNVGLPGTGLYNRVRIDEKVPPEKPKKISNRNKKQKSQPEPEREIRELTEEDCRKIDHYFEEISKLKQGNDY